MGQPGCLHQQLRYHQILDVSLFWAVSSGVRLKYDSPAIPPKQWVSIATCARFWLDNGFRSGADLVEKIGVGVSDLCGWLTGSDNPSWSQRRYIRHESFHFQISTPPSNQAQTGWALHRPGLSPTSESCTRPETRPVTLSFAARGKSSKPTLLFSAWGRFSLFS